MCSGLQNVAWRFETHKEQQVTILDNIIERNTFRKSIVLCSLFCYFDARQYLVLISCWLCLSRLFTFVYMIWINTC
jgi:hypothetical protein